MIDYGCGIGRVAKYIARRAKLLICLDINSDFLKRAKRFVNRKKNIHFYLSDRYKRKNVANLIYCLLVFQHNDDKNRTKIITHIYNLLKKGGTAVIQFPQFSSHYYQESSFVHKFKHSEVEKYGKLFGSYRIIKGNLPNYAFKINKTITHEYFLIAKKSS